MEKFKYLFSYFNFWKNDKLSRDFYHRISSIILLISGIFTFSSIFNLETLAGIGIYSGLFTITTISQLLNSFFNQFLFSNIDWLISTHINEAVKFGSQYLELLICSFILNFILLKLINYNLFGSEIKKNMYKLLNLKFFFIYYFIFVFILIFIIKLNIIHLDSKDVIVKANVSNVEITVSGDIIKEVLSGFGEIAAFSVGGRLALAAAAKHQLGVGSKIGISITSGTITAGAKFKCYETGDKKNNWSWQWFISYIKRN
jgi:hypothetical protein